MSLAPIATNEIPEELSKLPDGFSFIDPDVYVERVPHAEMLYLRRHDPVHWVDTPYGTGGYNDTGYWAISKHIDIIEISKRTNREFSTWQRSAIPRLRGNESDCIEELRLSMINQDGEEHSRKRRTISKGFTPRSIEKLRDFLQERANNVVSEALKKQSGDFVECIAAELPIQAISDLLGIPPEDRKKVFTWSNHIVSYDDPSIGKEKAQRSLEDLRIYSESLARNRLQEPQQDFVTTMVHADVNGEKLTPEELGQLVRLLVVAGSETTRNATALGMQAFLDKPEQWELFKRKRPSTTYDEILRWSSGSGLQRTAVQDVEIRGKVIKKGDRVVMLYGSANFDEDVFDDPFTFDITRDPNPHLTFGGNGPHYCLGANLAKLELELIFNAIANVMPDISSTSPARRIHSGIQNGIKTWQVDFRRCPMQK